MKCNANCRRQCLCNTVSSGSTCGHVRIGDHWKSSECCRQTCLRALCHRAPISTSFPSNACSSSVPNPSSIDGRDCGLVDVPFHLQERHFWRRRHDDQPYFGLRIMRRSCCGSAAFPVSFVIRFVAPLPY